ncbi:UNVERIFIED_CONTAM: hypothetical protein FKN15_006162 [Acipenser sinensis]
MRATGWQRGKSLSSSLERWEDILQALYKPLGSAASKQRKSSGRSTEMLLSETYGNVFTFHMGPKKYVVLTGYEAVKEALVTQADDFSERGQTHITEIFSKGGNGIAFGKGESWKVMRQFTLSTLRALGMGKKTIVDRIIEESQRLVEVFQSHKGKPFDPQIIINSAVSNIICSIMFGDRFDYSDAQFLNLQRVLNGNMKLIVSPKTQRNAYKDCKDSVDSNDPRSFIDTFISRQREEEARNSNKYFHEGNMAATVGNLFGAGTEPTSTTLRWGLLLMMKYPHIQDKVQEEIESVIGRERPPQAEDRKRMPYMDAVLHEIQRVGNVVPMNLLHETTGETTFRGYRIPKLSETYGSVFTFHMGPKKYVVLTGYEAVNEALVTQADDFSERGQTHTTEIFSKGGNGIAFGKGESWKVMRRFTLSTLRALGMGKKTIVDRIIEESQRLVEVFQSHKGKPFDPQIIINSAVSNIICSIMFGDRFDYSDAQFLNLQRVLNGNMKLIVSPKTQLYNVFPFLGFFLSDHKKIDTNQTMLQEYFRNVYKDRKDSVDSNDPRSFIDTFISRQREEEARNSNKYFHEGNMAATVGNLFGAGTETTSLTLRWGLLLMMKYPHIQGKVQEEIESVIGRERPPQAEDRKRMPYMDAVLHEIQRVGNVVPMNLLHETTGDTTFRGYRIPKGTPVIPLLSSVLSDKTQWETPHQFNPNHFLDAQGKFVKRDAFMPFSAGQCVREEQGPGRRVCPGETLAKMELFLFFTMLLQKFHFRPPQEGTPVIPLLSSVLSDKTQWETPHQFNPNHFLDAQGKFVKRDAFMPFSAGQCVREEQGPGRRVCPGETLAKMELFLFFTMLLQKFHFRPPQEVSPEQLDLTPTPGLTSGPQPFQLCALSH